MKNQFLRNPSFSKRIIIPAVLAIICVYLFYSINSGITITNDGSHFALFDSLVTTGSPELKQVRQFAFGDSAEYEGKYFSDRNPGLALFTYSFFQGTKVLGRWMKPLNLDPKFARNYNEGQKIRIRIVMLVPPLFGGLVFLCTFFLSREMGVGYLPALLSSLAVTLGTILVRYSTVFYSHIFATGLLVSSLLFVFSHKRTGSVNRLCIGIFLLSCAVLAEHLIIVVFLPVFAYLMMNNSEWLFRISAIVKLAMAGLLPMIVLMIYNWTCFNSPFSIAHFHHAVDTSNHELGTLLRFDHALVAANNLLFGAPKSEVGRQDLVGLFSSSPFLYFALIFPLIAGFGYRRITSEHCVLIASIILLILGGASVFAPYGGWDRDYRYFLAAIPLFAPFIGVVLDFLVDRGTGRIITYIKYLALIVFIALYLVSVRYQTAHIRHEGQIQYSHLLVNYEAALLNVSLFLAFALSVAVLTLALVQAYYYFFVQKNSSET